MRWRVAGTLKGVEGRGRGAYLGKDGVLYLSFRLHCGKKD